MWTGRALTVVRRPVRQPSPHPSGARPPAIPKDLVPRHVAIVMDGNGRWAKQRGLPRTKGHEEGESSLFDVVEGGIEIGVKAVLRRIEALAKEDAWFWRPSDLLKRLAETGEKLGK